MSSNGFASHSPFELTSITILGTKSTFLSSLMTQITEFIELITLLICSSKLFALLISLLYLNMYKSYD